MKGGGGRRHANSVVLSVPTFLLFYDINSHIHSTMSNFEGATMKLRVGLKMQLRAYSYSSSGTHSQQQKRSWCRHCITSKYLFLSPASVVSFGRRSSFSVVIEQQRGHSGVYPAPGERQRNTKLQQSHAHCCFLKRTVPACPPCSTDSINVCARTALQNGRRSAGRKNSCGERM